MTTTASFTVSTDLLDYAPGSTAYITATNVTAGATLQFEVSHVIDPGADGVWGTLDDVIGDDSGGGHETWTMTDGDEDGVIQTSWYVNPDDSLNATFLLTATGAGADEQFGTADDVVATWAFTDAAPPSPGNLNQWDNAGLDWQTGNLSSANYLEGDTVPYTLNLENLDPSKNYMVVIGWDTTQSGKHGIDYLTTYSRSYTPQNPEEFFDTTGDNQADHIFAIPADTIMTSQSDWSGSQVAGVFTAWNGTITGVTGYSVLGGLDTSDDYVANTTTTIGIKFDPSTSEFVLAWGGHLATRLDWGTANSAVSITGSPYHMKIIAAYEDTNGNGIFEDSQTETLGGGSQDRSVSSSAVIFPGSITVVKNTSPDGAADFTFSLAEPTEPGTLTNSFTLDDDADGTVSNTFSSGPLTVFGKYNLDETSANQGGYALTNIQILGDTDNGSTFNLTDGTVAIDLDEGENITITYTNAQVLPPAGTVTIQKYVFVAGASDEGAGAGWVDADTAPGPYLLSGANPQFKFVVYNASQVATNVTLTDSDFNIDTVNGDKTVDIQALGSFQTYRLEYIGAAWTAGQHTNTATIQYVSAVGPASATDDANYFGAAPSLAIDKEFVNVTGGDGDALADAVGDVLNYTVKVSNKGNVTLTGVTVVDPLTGQNISGVTLAPGATNTYNTSYTLTQPDLDQAGNAGSDGDIDNTAKADSAETGEVQDSVAVPLIFNPSIDINKVTISGVQSGDALNGVIAGTAIKWQYTVTNTGNVTLSNITVKDNAGTTAPDGDDFFATYISGDTNTNGKLDLTESWKFEKSAIAVAGSYSNIGTASGTIGTTTVTDTDPSSYFGTADVGQITPTGTTPNQYVNGTALDFSDFYASQGGVIQYNVNNQGKIGSTNPGVFFYYTGLSNAIKGVDVVGPAGVDPMTVKIDQSDSSTLFGAFTTTTNDVKLFKVTDLDGNGIDAGDTVTQVQLVANQITVPTSGANLGDVTVSFTPDAVGSLYVISVKYDTGSVVGTTVGKTASAWPTVTYTFNTDVGNNGTIDETAVGGIKIAPKLAALTLDGPVGEGAKALSDGELDHVIGQAIAYWAQHGASGADLASLRAAEVTITDLGGTTLAGSNDLGIWIDDDAAGHGWSLGRGGVAPDKVDLLSAVTHEFGHLLRLEHDVMDANLAVGERDLPLAGETDNAFPGFLVNVVGVNDQPAVVH